MKEVKYKCDQCGVEIPASVIASRPPWEPELCHKHYREHVNLRRSSSSYRSSRPKHDYRTWL